MSAKFSVYVGPYVVIPRSELSDWSKYEDIVVDGQFEAGIDSDNWYLIPQDQTPFGRQMRFDGCSEMRPVFITKPDIGEELIIFRYLCHRVLNTEMTHSVKWGVVPCLS